MWSIAALAPWAIDMHYDDTLGAARGVFGEALMLYAGYIQIVDGLGLSSFAEDTSRGIVVKTSDYNIKGMKSIPTVLTGFIGFNIALIASPLAVSLDADVASIFTSFVAIISLGTASGIYVLNRASLFPEDRGKKYKNTFIGSVLGSIIGVGITYLINPESEEREFIASAYYPVAVCSIVGGICGYNSTKVHTYSSSLNIFPMIIPKYQGIMIAKRF